MRPFENNGPHTHTHTHTHFTHPTTYTWLHTDTHPSQPLRNRQRGVIRLHTQPLSPSPHTHWHTRLHTQAHTRLRPICLIGELHTQLHTRLHTQLHTWFRARQVIHWATHTHTHTHWHTRLHTSLRLWDSNTIRYNINPMIMGSSRTPYRPFSNHCSSYLKKMEVKDGGGGNVQVEQFY